MNSPERLADLAALEGVRRLEALAARAWPAAEVRPLHGWLLRCTEGVTRRANSVLANDADPGAPPLAERLARVEEFYAGRGVPARFQLCPASRPPDLDDFLARRGYRLECPTGVQTASLAEVADRSAAAPAAEVLVADELREPWFAVYLEAEGVDEWAAAVRRGILRRIAARTGFALLRVDGRPAAVGLGVLEDGWVGVFNMVTRPEFRRRGLATAVLRALGRWAAGHGAERAYLQVVADNTPAVALYARLGFGTRYQYHYRTAGECSPRLRRGQSAAERRATR
jgi:ribosomal protein S18 acetylase RimI-like enzyme